MFGFAALLIASFSAIIFLAHVIEAYRDHWGRFQIAACTPTEACLYAALPMRI